MLIDQPKPKVKVKEDVVDKEDLMDKENLMDKRTIGMLGKLIDELRSLKEEVKEEIKRN